MSEEMTESTLLNELQQYEYKMPLKPLMSWTPIPRTSHDIEFEEIMCYIQASLGIPPEQTQVIREEILQEAARSPLPILDFARRRSHSLMYVSLPTAVKISTLVRTARLYQVCPKPPRLLRKYAMRKYYSRIKRGVKRINETN